MSNEETRKRVVVEGRHDGNVIPADVGEWHREVFIRPGAHVDGCVFGDSVTVTGPGVRVRKSVYALGELTIVAGGVVFLSTIASEGIVITRNCKEEVIVRADVFGEKVTLENCLVLGSVIGEEVRLRKCDVLGRVQGSRLVSLEDSMVQIVHAEELRFGKNCHLISAYARSVRRPRLEGPVGLAFGREKGESLTEEDIVQGGGYFHLQAGKRLTDLEQRRRRVEALTGFLLVEAFGDEVLGGGEEALATVKEDLHPRLRRILGE